MTLREEFPEVLRCYQCMSCTLGCPMAQEMDLLPHEVMGAVQLGGLCHQVPQRDRDRPVDGPHKEEGRAAGDGLREGA